MNVILYYTNLVKSFPDSTILSKSYGRLICDTVVCAFFVITLRMMQKGASIAFRKKHQYGPDHLFIPHQEWIFIDLVSCLGMKCIRRQVIVKLLLLRWPSNPPYTPSSHLVFTRPRPLCPPSANNIFAFPTHLGLAGFITVAVKQCY